MSFRYALSNHNVAIKFGGILTRININPRFSLEGLSSDLYGPGVPLASALGFKFCKGRMIWLSGSPPGRGSALLLLVELPSTARVPNIAFITHLPIAR